jgi:HAD superfamily hydrolase (TIGR01450 family)
LNKDTVDTEKLRRCALFLLDLDGTLYLGDEILPGAFDLLRVLQETGRRFIYLTNNSSRAGEDYVSRLAGMGFPCTSEDVFTSGMATALYLNEHFPGRTVYPVGTPAFERELKSFGVPLGSGEDSLVVVGFDLTLTYEKLERASHLLRRGAGFIAANPDLTCPMPGGEALPDCGSICALLTAATGREPLYIGKPDRRMVELCAARAGVDAAQVCCVGDRLYTDMAAAKNAGAVSALLLSGETTEEMLSIAAWRPDYVFHNAAALAAALSKKGGVKWN